MYAHDILGDLLYGANGYMDWNLFLDEKGGAKRLGISGYNTNIEAVAFESR